MMRIIHLQLFSKLFPQIQKEHHISFNIWHVVEAKSIPSAILSLICWNDLLTRIWMHGREKISHVIHFPVQIQKIGIIFSAYIQTCHSNHYWMNLILCNKDGDMKSIKMVRSKSRVLFSTKWKEPIKAHKDNLWFL